MIRFRLFTAILMLASPGLAATVTWGPLSIADNAGGLFLDGFSNFSSGATYEIRLPAFSQSDFPATQGEVDFGLTVKTDTAILGLLFEYTGSFMNPGQAMYMDTGSALTISDTASEPLRRIALTIMGRPGSVDIAGSIRLLADQGGSAAVSDLRITAFAAPEPSGFVLMVLGASFLIFRRYQPERSRFLLWTMLIVSLFSVQGWSQAMKRSPGSIRQKADSDPYAGMTAMGQLAHTLSRQLPQMRSAAGGRSFHLKATNQRPPKPDECDQLDEDCDATGFVGDGPGGGQAEMAIAIDPTGQHIVVGFNDSRGFNLNPISVSGFAYSDNGGVTFQDGGQLPAPVSGMIGTTAFPQVFGDPDVKFVPGGSGCQFIYSSLMVKGLGPGPVFTGTAQTVSVHRSTDCGHTWTGPLEVPAATNPGATLTSGNANDAADKEFMDVDPDTGRVLLSWSNFTATAIQIRTAYSDNVMSATTPDWSSGVVVDSGNMSGSIPRFAGNGSPAAYVSYSVSLEDGDNLAFSRSSDNGATWSKPILLAASDYLPADYIIGSDRRAGFPTMAVDNSGGIHKGAIYIAAATNDNLDGADVILWRSTDGGLTFDGGTPLDLRPGNDRAQWYPAIAVDDTTGRVNVMYNDQQVATSGDLMEMTWVYSENGGSTWSAPSPLTERPFHANYGNDSGQPNLGDYNMGVARNGVFYAAYPTTPGLALFTDIQTPQSAFSYPSFLPGPNPIGFSKASGPKAAIRLGAVTFTDSGGNGFADAGDQLRFQFPLINSLTNAALSPATYSSVSATLSTTTGGVTVLAPTRSYPNVAPGATVMNAGDFVVQIAPGFTPGTRIEFKLAVTTANASTVLTFTQSTGTPVSSVLFSQDFDGTAPGNLPSGWATLHAGGANTVPWTTRAGFCGSGSNALFHQEREDGPTTGANANNATRFERVSSPSIVIPPNAAYVTLDFDICYNTEDLAQYVPGYDVEAYDGAHFRITDVTPAHATLAVWAESFAESFTTGTIQSYPKHAPRSSDPNYFQDIPLWAGDSGGYQHVNMKLNGMAGTTVQLRPDYTQDVNGICTATNPANCGVAIDNLAVRSVTLKSDELSVVTLRPVAGQTGVFTGTVTAQPVAPVGGISVTLTSSKPGQTTMPSSVTIPAGSQVSPPFTVAISGTGSFTVTATGPSNTRSAGAVITP